MSFLWRLFRAEKPPDDYETVLSQLATNIQKRQTHLSEIRMRERKATMLVTLYTLLAWLAYLGVWYFGFVSGGGTGRVRGVERALRAAPVFVGPIFILFIRRIVQIWYNRKGNAEEKTLQTLMKEQRAKVEEIKKKTNFYSTRDLLSRYDASASAPGTPQRGGPAPPGTPQRGPAGISVGTSVGPASKPGAPGAPNANGLSASTSSAPLPPHQQQQPQPQPPSGPPQRRWFDALADLLVGVEDNAPASQRYALICEKCFAHNGLVPEVAWADAQYKCPKCGHFNASARSRRVLERAQATSPTSPTSPLSPGSGSVSAIGTANMMGPAGASASASARPAGGDVRRRSERKKGGRGREEDGEGEGEGEMMEVDS